MADERKYSAGFAIVPKEILRDRDLHVVSKAIYCYLASYADKEGKAYPSRSLICNDLGITNGTLSKHLKQLTDKGYLTIEKNKQRGRFCNNVYVLTVTDFSDTVFSDTVFSDTKFSDTKKQSLTIPVLNNTNINNTSINNTSVRETRARDEPLRLGEFQNVKLTDSEFERLKSEIPCLSDYIERLSTYMESTGKTYKSHFATIKRWYKDDVKNGKVRGGSSAGAYTDLYDLMGD